MALDAQLNWNTSMAQSLTAIKSRTISGGMPRRTYKVLDPPKQYGRTTEDTESHFSRPPVYLPDELILEILNYVSGEEDSQQTLWACCLLSRQWYNAAVPLLYARPMVKGKSFDPFTRAICPSINLHIRKSPLSGLVKTLNMSHLIHHGSKSLTARLLGRTKESLEEFVAPQASFAINCYPALSKCTKLRLLDLSLVSESAPLKTLFNTVKSLVNLETLRLPRSSGFGNSDLDPDSICWPPRLRCLFLSGGIDAHFLYGIVNFPATLEELTIEHCPQAKGHAVRQLLTTLSQARVPIKYLKIANMPRFGINTLDLVLAFFPALETLSVSIDYITPAILNPEFQEYIAIIQEPDFSTHALRTLELTNSGNPGDLDKFSPIDVIIAIEEGSFPLLRSLKVAKSLEWGIGETRQEMDALDEQLLELEQRDWEERRGDYAEMSTEQWKATDYKKRAGVWIFEA